MGGASDPYGTDGGSGGGGGGGTPSGGAYDAALVAKIEKQLGMPAGTIANMPPAARAQVAAAVGVSVARLTPPAAGSGALSAIAGLLSRYPGAKQIDATHVLLPNGRVATIEADANGSPTLNEWTEGDSNAYLNNIKKIGGDPSVDGDGSGSGTRLASDDPRYWANLDRQFALDVATLEAQLQNNGLDAESARRQALTTLITNRNNTAVDVGNLSNDVAKTAAEFAANPRDAVAELMYRNQTGGNAFGDMTNDNFGEYGKALADKAASIFSPVQADLQQARVYRDSIPPVDFFGQETREQLGLPPTPAQQLQGATGVAMQPVGAGTPPPAAVAGDPLNAMTDRLKAMSPEEQNAFQRYTTIASGHGWQAPKPLANGGTLNFDDLYDNRNKAGDAPTSTEGGLNINLNERAIVVTESGKVLATLGERRPDGTVRAEQLQVKPLKSEVEKDKKLADADKAKVESQKKTLAAFADGGTITAGQSPDDFMAQLSQYLGGLGGSGGGTGGYKTPLPSLRLLAGEPANSLEDDPVALDYTLAGYSALGIDPRTVAAQIKKFTPASAQRVGQTNVRTSW